MEKHVNVAVPFNNIEHRDANIVHKITTIFGVKGGEHLSAIGVTDDFHCVTTRLLISPAPKPRWIGQVDRSKAKTIYKPNSYGTTS